MTVARRLFWSLLKEPCRRGRPKAGRTLNCLPPSAQQNRFVSLLCSHNIIKWGEHPLCIHCLLGSELPEDKCFNSYRIFSPCPRLLNYHKHVSGCEWQTWLGGSRQKDLGARHDLCKPCVWKGAITPNPHHPSLFQAPNIFFFTRKN